MQLRRLMVVVLVALCAMIGRSFAQNAPAEKSAERRPNVLFFLIDDQGYRDWSCFGSDRAKTPNIDKLGAEGIKFDQFYVAAPICSPSRVGFTTGQYPLRWNITSYLANSKEDADRGINDWLDPKAQTLARILSGAGYYTAHVGKWHMGGQRNVADAPPITDYGFATSLTSFEGLGERILPKFRPQENGKPFIHGPTVSNAENGGPGVHWVDRDKVSAAYIDRAIEEIKNAQKANKPFYINLWTDDVHSPMEAPEDRVGDGTPPAQYVGVLEELDKQIERIFDVIRNDASLRDNTIIFVCSDNGPERGLGSSGSLRGSKGQLYEGGIRSPLIVWGPGFVKSEAVGSTNKSTVMCAVDLAPSVLALTGVKQADNVMFDGKDMLKQMTGKSDEARDGVVTWVRPPDRGGPNNSLPDLAIRDGKWKALVHRDGSNLELFDIQADPDENNNLAKENPDIAKNLSKQVIAWEKKAAFKGERIASKSPMPGK